MADFQSSKDCIVAQVRYVRLKFRKTLVTRYNLPNHKVSNQFKSYNGFWIYPPLWTSHFVAKHDDIGNRYIYPEDWWTGSEIVPSCFLSSQEEILSSTVLQISYCCGNLNIIKNWRWWPVPFITTQWFWRERSQGYKMTFDSKFWRPFLQ